MNIFSIFDFKSCLNDLEERYRQFDPKEGPFRLKFLSEELIEFYKKGFELYSNIDMQHFGDKRAIDLFKKKMDEVKKTKESVIDLSDLKRLIAECKELNEIPETKLAYTIETNLPKYAQISASLLLDATWENFPDEFKALKAEWLKCGKFAHYPTAAILEAFSYLRVLKNTFKEARKEISFLKLKELDPLFDRINTLFIPGDFLEKYRSHLENQLSLATKEKETLVLAILDRLKFMSENRKQSQFKLPSDDILADLISKVKGSIQEGPWAILPRLSHFSEISNENFYQVHYRVLKQLDVLAKDKDRKDSHDEIKKSFDALFWITGNNTCKIHLIRKNKKIIIVPKSHEFLAGDVNASYYKGPHIADFALYQIQNEQLNDCLQKKEYDKVSKLIDHISRFLIQQKQSAKNPSENKKLIEAWQRIFLEMTEKLIEKASAWTDDCLKNLLDKEEHDLSLYEFIKSLKLVAFEFEKSAARNSPIPSLLEKIKKTEKSLLQKNYIIKVDQCADAYFYYFDKLNLVISASLQTSIDPILGMKNAEYPQALHQLEEAISQIWKDKGLSATILQRLLAVQLKACLKPNKDLFTLVQTFEMQSAFRDVNMMGQWINAHTPKLNDILAKFLKVDQYPLKELNEDLEILRLCEKYVPGNWKTLKEYLLKYIEDVDLEELEKIKQLENNLAQKHEKPDLNQLVNLENREKNCAKLLLLLNDESLILAYGHKYLAYYEKKNFFNINANDEFAELCFLPELRNAVSQKLLAFCLKNIRDIFPYFSDWAQLNNYLTSEDAKTFSKEFSAIFFEKLDRQFSSKGDFRYLQKFLSFKFAFLPADRVAVETKLKEITQKDWDNHLGQALEFLYKYLDLESLQSFRLKWFKGLATHLNMDPKIPKFYEPKIRGFDGLCSFYGVEFLPEVFESIKELYKQPEMSKYTYDLLGKYLDTKADSSEQSDESPFIQKMYLEYCTLADQINESLTSQIPVIGEVIEMMDGGNYKVAFEKIEQHCRQLPSRHVTRLTQHQVRVKQVMGILYDKIENWLINKISDENFDIEVFKNAFTPQMTPRLEVLCAQTVAILTLGNNIRKLADGCEKDSINIHDPLCKIFSDLSQWYLFLMHNQLFSLLNCQPAVNQNLLKESIQKIFMRTHDPLLKKACMILMPFLRNPSRLHNDVDLKNQEIAFLQILCKMFLRDSYESMGSLEKPYITRKLGLDLQRLHQIFSKDLLYQEKLPELKILSWLKRFAERKSLTISLDDLKKELQKTKHDNFAFPLSSSWERWDFVLQFIFNREPMSEKSLLVKNSVLGERYLNPEIQKKLFDENHKLIEEAKVKGHFKNTVAFAEINSDVFYFKFSPRGIGIQTMVSKLERILFGEGLPITLMKLNYNINGKKEPCPVQISLGVKGETVSEVWNKRKENFKVDLKNFSQNFVRILLDRELDGQPGNYVATLQQNSQFYSLRVIDSEQGFGKLEGKNSLQIVSLILCLDEMKQPLDSDVVNHIISLDPYDMISQFIADIDIQTQQYLSLFNQKERQDQFNQKEMAFLLPPLTREMVRDIFMTFCQLQDILKKYPGISHLEVLKKIHPSVAMSYEHVLQQEEMDPQARFEQVSQEQKRHEIVDEAEGRSYMSSLSNREFYKTISPKKLESEKDLKEEIIKPSEALEYLNELKKLYEELESIQKDLLNDDAERFLKIEDSFLKEAVINGIEGRFKGISFQAISKEQQEKILSYMEGMVFRSLRLKGCSETLTPQKLESLLRSSPNLQLLDITGCKKIDDKAFQDVTLLVRKIEALILDDTDLTLETYFMGNVLYSLKDLRHLQYLSLRNCQNLKNLVIMSPVFKKIYFDDSKYQNLKVQRFVNSSSVKDVVFELLVLPKMISDYTAKIKKSLSTYPLFYQDIKKSQRLESLIISKIRNLENTEEHLENITEIIHQHQNTIKTIYLSDVNLNSEQILDIIKKIPKLIQLRLEKSVINEQSLEVILNSCRNLRYITLLKCLEISQSYIVEKINKHQHLSIVHTLE